MLRELIEALNLGTVSLWRMRPLTLSSNWKRARSGAPFISHILREQFVKMRANPRTSNARRGGDHNVCQRLRRTMFAKVYAYY